MESLVGRNTVSHPEVSYTNPLQSTLIGTAQTVHTSVAMDGTVYLGMEYCWAIWRHVLHSPDSNRVPLDGIFSLGNIHNSQGFMSGE